MKGNQQTRTLGEAQVSDLAPVSREANGSRAYFGDSEFSSLLRQLSEGIRKEDVKQREGWRDKQGNVHYVDYVEWPTVADLLDKIAPAWSHAVRSIIQIGPFVAATAAITINGVTREGIGTGSAESETGIKKAEHDALKRAAVKFGVARDLYRDEDKIGDGSKRTERREAARPVTYPIARTITELVTPKQLFLIRKLAENHDLDAEAMCQESYHAGLDEISRRAASALIERLNAMSEE